MEDVFNININSPIFIVGVGRSGTTLIQSMLNAHKDIAFTPETHFLRNYIGNISVNKKLVKNDVNYIINKINNDENLKRTDMNLNEIINLIVKKGEFNLVEFYKKLLKNYAKARNKSMIGDKDPKNIEYLHDIKRIFPNAYIVHIIRDPRDVVVSRMKAEWSRDRNFLTHVIAYREQLHKGIRDGKKLFGNHYFELFYEDLIEYPEKTLKKVCKYLNISYDSGMLHFNEKADKIIKGKERQWKENCFKPVISNNKNKWKNKLNRHQVLLVENICNKSFRNFGYKKSEYWNEMGSFKKIYFIFLSFLFIFFDYIYNFYHNLRWFRIQKNINLK